MALAQTGICQPWQEGRPHHFVSWQLGGAIHRKNNNWLLEREWAFIRASVTGWGSGLSTHISSELADILLPHSGGLLSSTFCPNPPLSDCPSTPPTLLHLPWVSGNALFLIDHACLLSAALPAPCKAPSVLATDKYGHVTHTSSFPPLDPPMAPFCPHNKQQTQPCRPQLISHPLYSCHTCYSVF